MPKTFDLSDALNEVNGFLYETIKETESVLCILAVISEDDEKEYILEQLEKVKDKVQSILHNLK